MGIGTKFVYQGQINKLMIRIYIILFFMAVGVVGFSQSDTTKPVKVAVFIPLHVGEVFKGGQYSYDDNNSLPKYIMPGLEFYNGVMLAIDSLEVEGIKAEISIYDTKKIGQSLDQLLESTELKNVQMVIAAITNTTELKSLSTFGQKMNVPIISATYPNIIGVSENPFFVLLNSSFQSHLQGIYRFMLKYYSTNNIIAITRKGTTEDYIKTFIIAQNKSATIPINLKWVNVNDSSFVFANIESNMDSTKENVVFVASPSENFGLKVVKELSSNELYNTTAIGMPTWDGVKSMDKRECKNVTVVYSTPFLYSTQNPGLNTHLNEVYKEKYFCRPSDMVFKGYETIYHFTKLLVKHRANLINNLYDKDFALFHQFNLEPVRIKPTNFKPDYIENKKLYFIKKQQGIIKSVL